MKSTRLLTAAALSALCVSGHAAELYTGAGFPGYTLGLAHSFDSGITARVEYAGGINVSRDGRREGLDYRGTLKTGRTGIFADWHPFAGSFRLTGGYTANDIKVDLQGTGSAGTINGKPVNLTGETFNVNVKYKPGTPYLGLGWGHQGSSGGGLGFFLDVGAQFGKFETTVATSIVGKYGVTQADVDAEAQKVRDNVGQFKVLPSAAAGLTYRF